MNTITLNNERCSRLAGKAKTAAMLFAAGGILIGAMTAHAETASVVLMDPSQNWQGWMNVTPAAGNSWGSVWNPSDLSASFVNNILFFTPNTSLDRDITKTNANWSLYWDANDNGIAKMEANCYVETNSLAGQPVTFSGYCISNTLAAPYSTNVVAFIKEFSKGSLVAIATNMLKSGSYFSVTLPASVNPSGHTLQYGFEMVGPNAKQTNAANLGFVAISSNYVAPITLAAPTNTAPTPTNANVLCLYNSSNTYLNIPSVTNWWASWSLPAPNLLNPYEKVNFTITNTGKIVKKYSDLQFAGVEFTNANHVDASSYNVLHVDVWTPNATMLSVKLVSSLWPNEVSSAVVMGSNKVTTNSWSSLDIPLSWFVDNNPNLVFSNLQQLVWSSDEIGTFYIDNVYFYTDSNIPLLIALAAPTNTAPTPTNANVLCLYNSSNTYLNIPSVTNWWASWSLPAPNHDNSYENVNFTITNTTKIVKKYSNLKYAGVEFTNANHIDASHYTRLHVDLWTPNANEFSVKLVSTTGSPEVASEVVMGSDKITTNSWCSLTFNLAWFIENNPNLDLSNLQMLVWSCNKSRTFYIDNVYFYTDSTAAPEVPAVVGSTVLPVGSNAVFTASVFGTGLTYQWQKWQKSPLGNSNNFVNLINGPSVSGATSTTLTLLNIQGSDEADYRLQVTNQNGSAASPDHYLVVLNLTNLTINPAAPWQGYVVVHTNNGGLQGGVSKDLAYGLQDLRYTSLGGILSLYPNTKEYAVNPTNADGSSTLFMEASCYVGADGLAGRTLKFVGYCPTNSLDSNYTAFAWIKEFTNGYAGFILTSNSLVSGKPFSLSYTSTDASNHVQYGFNIQGPVANPSSAAAFERVQVSIIPPTMSATRTLSNSAFSFFTEGGHSYSVEYKTNLTDSLWLPCDDSSLYGTGSKVNYTNSTGVSQRFYRLIIY